MALIQCYECGNSISTQATSCPKCGAPQQHASETPPVKFLPEIGHQPGRQEQTIYSDSNVSVTTTRVMIGDTTYALRNITSVRMADTPGRIGCAITLLILGIVLLIGAFSGVGEKDAGGLVIAGVVIGLAVLWLFGARTKYHVVISSASGEAKALTSRNERYIQRIVNSINEAIVKYR